jgi:3-oxoacyl-[acyl-carrier protein] reductase
VDVHAEDRTRTDRVAIVTGGSRGVGCEIARNLAARGYAVVIGYASDHPAAEAAIEEILAAHGTALAVRADVADELDVERMFDETTEAFGGVDVVIHAAGQMHLGPAVDDNLGRFDALLGTKVRGMLLVNQLAAHELRPGGAIVNLFRGSPASADSNSAAYAICKIAVAALTLTLANELGRRDITVNGVAALNGRSDTLAGVANVVAFLVGAEGHCVNGQVICAAVGPIG